MLKQKTLHDKQLEIEEIVMGKNFDTNHVSSLIADDLTYTISKFQRIPAWLRNIQEMDIEKVSFLGLLALIDSVSSERGCGQVHGVISQMANKFRFLCDHDRRVRCGLAFNVIHCMREAGLIRLTTTKRGEPTTVVSMTRYLRDMLTEHELWGLMGLSRRPMIVKPIPHTVHCKGGYLSYDLRKGVANGDWKNVTGQAMVDGMNVIQNTEWTVSESVLRSAEYLLEPFIQARDTDEYAHDGCLRVANEFVGLTLWNPTYCDTRGRVLKEADQLSEQGNDLMRGLLVFGNEMEMTDDGLLWHFVHVANCCSGLPVADGIKLDKLRFEDRIAWVRDNIRTLLQIARNPIAHRDLYWDGFGKGAMTFQALGACDDLLRVIETKKTRIPCMNDFCQNNYQWSAGMTRDTDLARRVNLLPLEDDALPNDLHLDVASALGKLWEDGEADHEWMPVFLENKETLTERKRVKPASMVIGYNGTRRGISKYMLGKKAWENVGTEDEPTWVLVAGQDSSLHGIDIPLEEHSSVAFHLAGDMEVSVFKVAPTAKDTSDAVSACAKVANDKDMPMMWMSASGMLVVNHPNTKEEFNLQGATCWNDQTCTQIKFTVFTDELNKRKAITSAPPNFTHSLDASHMHISCVRLHLALLEMWIQTCAVASVHDCYGSHAPVMGMFRGIILNTMADIIELEPLHKLCEAYGVETPEYGDLNPDEIRNAIYALM